MTIDEAIAAHGEPMRQAVERAVGRMTRRASQLSREMIDVEIATNARGHRIAVFSAALDGNPMATVTHHERLA